MSVRQVLRWSIAAAAVLMLLAAGWWAGRATLRSAADQRGQHAPTVVATVTEASVGRSLTMAVTVEQPFVVVAVNGLAGTVTSVDLASPVDMGDVLYTVDTIPVRAVAGSLPFYRDLGPGQLGRDVSQLQRALRALGYYNGGATGRYDYRTGQAVRAWQRALKVPVTGAVRLGEVIAVPRLPAALRLGEHIVKGSRLGGGEQAVFAPTGELRFALVVSQAQAALIPPDASVTVTYQRHTWPAVITDSAAGAEGTTRFTLAAPDGGAVCAEACDRLPGQERLSMRAAVTVIPEATGPAVPMAAVYTNPDGSAYVVMEDGERREVTVRGSSGGVAVVDGVHIGDRVRVLSAPAVGEGG